MPASRPPPRRVARATLLAGTLLITLGCSSPSRPPASTATRQRVTQTLAAEPAQQSRVAQAPAGVDWPDFDHDAQRTGINASETAITPATAGGLQRVWSQTLPEKSGGSPIELSDVAMPDGTTRNLLFLTTSHGTTLAIDATSGAVIWQQATSGPQIGNQPCQVCATPVADPSRQWIYASGNDGDVHRYAVTTGQEDTTPPWPVAVTLMNGYEKRSSALNLANGTLYVTVSGYNGDFGPYDGHVVAVNLAGGAINVFNVLCSDQQQLLASPTVVPNTPASCSKRQAGVWARAGAVVDQSGGPTDGSIYLATGNGPFDANQGGVDYGDSVLRLSGDASQLLDSWTPADYQRLDDGDIDLGSTAPALLPALPSSSTPYLAVQGGKDSVLRLLDRTKLGGVGGELQAINLGIAEVLAAPIAWTDPQDPAGTTWVFVAGNQGLVGFQVQTDAAGKTSLAEQWRVQGFATSPILGFATSPILAGGVLFVAGSNAVTARDPHTGKVLWSSAQSSTGGGIGAVHWQTPIVVNGCLYMADESAQLSAYCLPSH